MNGAPGRLSSRSSQPTFRWYSTFSEFGSPRPSAASLDRLRRQIINRPRGEVSNTSWLRTDQFVYSLSWVRRPPIFELWLIDISQAGRGGACDLPCSRWRWVARRSWPCPLKEIATVSELQEEFLAGQTSRSQKWAEMVKCEVIGGRIMGDSPCIPYRANLPPYALLSFPSPPRLSIKGETRISILIH